MGGAVSYTLCPDRIAAASMWIPMYLFVYLIYLYTYTKDKSCQVDFGLWQLFSILDVLSLLLKKDLRHHYGQTVPLIDVAVGVVGVSQSRARLVAVPVPLLIQTFPA